MEVLLNGFGTQIIYITGFIEYCEDVYETEHIYFLKKPVEPAKLNEALKEAVKQIEEYNNKAIVIQNGGIFTKIRTQDIFYIESDRRKLRFFCKGRECETYDKISNIILTLGEEFVQCHKSYVVNMRYIRELQKTQVILENDMSVVVSRNFYGQVKDKLIHFVSGI